MHRPLYGHDVHDVQRVTHSLVEQLAFRSRQRPRPSAQAKKLRGRRKPRSTGASCMIFECKTAADRMGGDQGMNGRVDRGVDQGVDRG